MSAHKSLTGIVAALDEEVVELRLRLVGARPAGVSGARVTLGALGGVPVALGVTGDGEHNARRGLAAMLAVLPLRRIIVIGVAGGLDTSLDVGALVIGAHVIDEAGGGRYRGDPALVDLAASVGAAAPGVAISARRIADTLEEKRRLLALARAQSAGQGDAGADPSPAPVVVDLESAAYAALARRAGVPWLVLRAVSDTAAESLPALLNRSRDDGGAVRRLRVVRGLLSDPRALRPLLALRDRVRACADRLARSVGLVVGALPALDDAAVTAAPTGAEPTRSPPDFQNPIARPEARDGN